MDRVGCREHGRAWWLRSGSHSAASAYRDRRVRLGRDPARGGGHLLAAARVRTIYLGQVNLILMAAIMWDLCQPDLRGDGRRRWWKGAVTGVAAGIKLVPLIFVPYLLITRRFREAAATVVGLPRHHRRRVRRPAARLLPVVAARHVHGRRQPGRIHGLGGQPVTARDHHPVRGVRRGRAGPVDRRRGRRAGPRHDRRLSARPGRVPGARPAGHGADRPARLPDQLGPSLGLDRPRDRGAGALRRRRSPGGAAADRPLAVGAHRRNDLLSSARGRTRSGRTRGPSATSPSASCGRSPTPTRSCSPSTATSPGTSSTTGTASSSCGATPTSSPGRP